MSTSRLTATPPSVAPYASITSTPKRREKLSTTSGEPSLPNATRNVLSASSALLGLREEVRERLAGVVEVGRSVAANVAEPPRRREAAAEADRARRHERRRPPDLHRVRVEQRHAHVADVVGAEVHDHRHALAGDEQAPLRADHGLRRVRRARREDQRPDRVDVGLEARDRLRRRAAASASCERRRRAGRRIAGVGEPGRREDRWQPVGDRREQRLVARLGEHEPAVRVLRVAQEVLVAARVVETDDRGADQRRAPEREEVVGRVVEQDRDVARCAGRAAARGTAPRTGTTPRSTRACVHVWSPNLIATRSPNSRRVATQERGRVGRDERGLSGSGDRSRSTRPDMSVRSYASRYARR